MALELNSAESGGRAWQRHHCGTEGVFVADGVEARAYMVDASRGGFKLRFEQVEGVMAALDPPPREITVDNVNNTAFPAVVLWTREGLAGCRFFQHLSLDDVAGLMTSRFRIYLPQQQHQ